MRKIRYASLLLLLAASNQALAKEQMYALFGLNYTEAEQGQASNKGMGYSFAMGYELDRQWFVELGFQQLLDEDAGVLSEQELGTDDNSEFKGDALYLALLGKASSRVGTLFYRVGVMSVKVQSQSIIDTSQSCERGEASAVTLSGGVATACTVDDTAVAGVVGLGFDYNLSDYLDLRTELQHIRGQDDLQFNLVQLGIRYNF